MIMVRSGDSVLVWGRLVVSQFYTSFPLLLHFYNDLFFPSVLRYAFSVHSLFIPILLIRSLPNFVRIYAVNTVLSPSSSHRGISKWATSYR